MRLGIVYGKARRALLRAEHKLLLFRNFKLIELGIRGYVEKTTAEAYKSGVFNEHVRVEAGRQQINEDTIARENGRVPIRDMHLSKRSTNALLWVGLNTAEDVVALRNRAQLARIRNLGVLSQNEIIKKLEEMGYNVAHLW